jgi:uncharacterized protein
MVTGTLADLGLGEAALLAGAGFLAGGVNAVAGGGSLISFPALLAVGYPSVDANVTNSVAVLPGYLGGSIGYRRELRGQRRRAGALAATSAAGALAGALLLLLGPESVFEAIVPFLILFACGLLAVQPLISRRLAPRSDHDDRLPVRLHAAQFAAAVYGGYFGAGLGLLLLAVLALFVDDDLQRLNALKGLLSLLIGAVAALYFALFGPVAWAAAGIMALTTLAGGQAGVGVARRLSPGALRAVVIAFGVAVAVVLLV